MCISYFPWQFQTDACLKRFLKAFLTVDQSFEALVKYIKWRKEYGVETLNATHPDVEAELSTGKVLLPNFKDKAGRYHVLVQCYCFKVRGTLSNCCDHWPNSERCPNNLRCHLIIAFFFWISTGFTFGLISHFCIRMLYMLRFCVIVIIFSPILDPLL